ncbi:MAG: hypothetical protein U0744_15955 [Gemmataceae bacterium]
MSKAFCIGAVLATLAMMLPMVSAAEKETAPPTTLTAGGEALRMRYAETLGTLQSEISKALPEVSETKKVAYQAAREAVKKAMAEANAAQQRMDKIGTAKALVDHANGKWLGGAAKGIARAEQLLKKASTEAERAAANKELAKWQADKEAGLKALKERQDAYDKAKADEPKFAKAKQETQAALARATSNELATAKAILAEANQFLASDKLDAKLTKCAVLAQATPRGLAEFAQQGKAQEALVEQLLTDAELMKEMLEAGGARGGAYGQAMQIYADIRKASSRAAKGIFHRLALGTALAHAVPIPQRNAAAKTDTPSFVDPVKRYLHYEKAHLDGELDPAFEKMTAWECRMIVNSDAPDHVLAWGREMLRNYRPDHIFNSNYGWRYSGVVRTDVAYRNSQFLKDDDSLEFFQNVIKEGGVCGRRAFFGRFIVKSFGLPTWGVGQPKHAAIGRWTPSGWVVNLGAGWQFSWSEDRLDHRRTGADFILETQARKQPDAYWKVLRAQWVGDCLSEPKCDSTKYGSGGLWNNLALYEKKTIVAEAKPAELAALGADLAEADESAAAKGRAVEKAVVAEADKKTVIDKDGVITVPAAACGGGNQLVKSFLGGQQMICSGPFACDIHVAKSGKYLLSARVVTVHADTRSQVTSNAKGPIDMAVPFTLGSWQRTEPVEVELVQGKNTLSFSRPTTSFALRDLTITPAK